MYKIVHFSLLLLLMSRMCDTTVSGQSRCLTADTIYFHTYVCSPIIIPTDHFPFSIFSNIVCIPTILCIVCIPWHDNKTVSVTKSEGRHTNRHSPPPHRKTAKHIFCHVVTFVAVCCVRCAGFRHYTPQRWMAMAPTTTASLWLPFHSWAEDCPETIKEAITINNCQFDSKTLNITSHLCLLESHQDGGRKEFF
jgi:hypothetical protein